MSANNGSSGVFPSLSYPEIYQLRNLANTPQTQELFQKIDALYISCIEQKKTPDGSDLSVVLMVLSDRTPIKK